MNVKQGIALAAMAATMAACGGQSGPKPVATISVQVGSVATGASEAAVKTALPLTLIEFYAEW